MRVKTFFPELRGCSYGSELARLSGLARRGEMIFYPTLTWNLLSQFNQKVYVAGKKLFDQVFFTIR